MLMSDAAVIGRVRAGDPDAFSMLVARYHDRCARLAARLLGDDDDVADAVQEAFIRAYYSLDSYQERDRFGAWLMCIVANRCHSARSARTRRMATAGEWWRIRALSADVDSPAERDHALAEQLGNALQLLPAETREAVISRHALDMSYEELAMQTGAGVSALKMRVARGSARLRGVLAGAGVTLATVALVVVAHAPEQRAGDSGSRPAAAVACDTLAAILRDTLSPAVNGTVRRDSALFPPRCGGEASPRPGAEPARLPGTHPDTTQNTPADASRTQWL